MLQENLHMKIKSRGERKFIEPVSSSSNLLNFLKRKLLNKVLTKVDVFILKIHLNIFLIPQKSVFIASTRQMSFLNFFFSFSTREKSSRIVLSIFHYFSTLVLRLKRFIGKTITNFLCCIFLVLPDLLNYLLIFFLKVQIFNFFEKNKNYMKNIFIR